MSKRRSSSIAVGSRLGSARRRASASGWRKSVHQPFPAPFTDASWPALRSRTQVADELGLGQRVAVVDDRREGADQVVARSCPSLGEQVAQVGAELDAGRRRPCGPTSSDGFSSYIRHMSADHGRR